MTMAEVGTDGLRAVFRNAMAGVCTPVSVVTSIAMGMPYGTTVNAFASLSMDPPMVLVSLDRTSELLTAIRASRRFGLNILASNQVPLALNFARKGGTRKFEGVRWDIVAGVPRIPGTGGFIACEGTELVDGGDHVLVLGYVRAVEAEASPPLTYYARAFGTHAALTDAGILTDTSM